MAFEGGNVDLWGAYREREQLFERDIPGLQVQHAKNFLINDFQLVWSNTSMPYFAHGIEGNNFSNLSIHNFSETASPVNKNAATIYVTEGTGFVTDNKVG